MVRQPADLSPLRRFFVTADAKWLGLAWGGIMCLAFSVRPIMHFGLSRSGLIVVVFNLVIWGLASLAYGNALARQFRRRDKQIGLTPNSEEKVELYRWQRYGVKPSAARLQPVLPAYLSYLQANLSGRHIHAGKTGYMLSLVVFGGFFLVTGALLVSQFTVINLLMCVIFGIMLASGLVARPGRPHPLVRLLNHRQLQRVAAMRRQL